MSKNYLRKKYLFILLLTILISSLTISCDFLANDSNKANQIESNKMIVHYIDVGQGDSILIQVNNKNLCIYMKIFYDNNKNARGVFYGK